MRLADGIDVRLPEFEVEKALATLSKVDKDTGLFSRDITVVDMRLVYCLGGIELPVRARANGIRSAPRISRISIGADSFGVVRARCEPRAPTCSIHSLYATQSTARYLCRWVKQP